jgi:hypothetical protein
MLTQKAVAAMIESNPFKAGILIMVLSRAITDLREDFVKLQKDTDSLLEYVEYLSTQALEDEDIVSRQERATEEYLSARG